ncbi:AAA family ATPase [Candidatus Saccharibacteria bacterium]|nr:AAA family ATPase [Candidatus Saccharibacteria bacterium]
MIIFFGPAGSGKSAQGRLLESDCGWKWLSMGQLLRDSMDGELDAIMGTGKLVPYQITNQLLDKALKGIGDISKVVIDGYPRQIEQATWLDENYHKDKNGLDLGIILDVPKEELLRRMEGRGRADDTPDAIDERLKIFQELVKPAIEYISSCGIRITTIDGVGTKDEVHQRIVQELIKCNLM